MGYTFFPPFSILTFFLILTSLSFFLPLPLSFLHSPSLWSNSTLFTSPPPDLSLPRSVTMADHDDLATTKTEGFKVGEKKSMQQYNELGMDSTLDIILDNALSNAMTNNK